MQQTMRCARRALVCAALPLVLALTACETKSVSVRLPGFGGGDVEGLWLWRLSATSGQYERVCRIDLSDAELSAQGEFLTYSQSCNNGHPEWEFDLRATTTRSPGSPATVTIEIFYMRWEEAGTYRASAFNAAGESALSPTSLQL